MSTETTSPQTVEDWAAWKASGQKRLTLVGTFGNGRAHGTLLSVAKAGLRVRTASGLIERWHPSDVRPGWLS